MGCFQIVGQISFGYIPVAQICRTTSTFTP